MWRVPVATIDAIRLPAQHFAFTHSISLREGVEPLATEQNADGSRTSRAMPEMAAISCDLSGRAGRSGPSSITAQFGENLMRRAIPQARSLRATN
jgi:hypothetical protein